MENKTWEQVKKFYKDKFGVEPTLVELVADYDILKLCASGSSNKTISEFLNISIELVSNTIDKYFGFDGWIYGLPFSPLNIYKLSETNQEFREKLDMQGYVYYPNEISKMWEISKLVSDMEITLNEKWI